MRKFSKASAEVTKVCQRMLRAHHPELDEVGLKVDLLFAHTNPEDPQPPLRLHGYACYAICKINSGKLRAQGHGDIEIAIDHDHWKGMLPRERDALMDHELQHVARRINSDGDAIFDAYDRPKLFLRHHDHQFGWFDEVARRHGEASIEVQQYTKFQERQQTLWDPEHEADEEPAALPLTKNRAAAN
ncbi:MAG: putative metallopeptidase [Pirellulales bacterium]